MVIWPNPSNESLKRTCLQAVFNTRLVLFVWINRLHWGRKGILFHSLVLFTLLSLVFAVGRKVDASSLLEKLDWLPVKKRIIFKVLLYVYKALNNSAPSYLSQCFTLYHPSRQLRSSEDKTLLCIPRELTAIGRKNFNIAAAYAWNELPRNIRLAPSTAAFKRLLKTHLFWYVCFCIHVSLLCFVYDFVSAVVLTWIAHLNALLLLLLLLL